MIPDPRQLFSRVLEAEKARGEIYLSNHSLGRMPDAVATNVERGIALWSDRMDGSWEEGGWMDETDKFRRLVATLIGFPRPDCVVPKASAGQGLRAVLNAYSPHLPINVVTTSGEFDSIDFILKAYRRATRANVKFVEPTRREGPVDYFEPDPIIEAIHPGTDLVIVSAVMFGTGQVMPGLAHIVHQAHAYGALVMVDCYHSAGVLPLPFHEIGVDFVIGGCYKYLRGGPGAGFLAVSPRLLDREEFRTRDTGWFAKLDKFAYDRVDECRYAEGGDAWLESTPAVLTAYQATPGIELVTEWGVEELRVDSLAKQQQLRESLIEAGHKVFQPKRPENWGAFSLVESDDAPALARQFKARGVNVDARSRFVRFCPDLLTTDEDIEKIRTLMA